jgi:hypothetical protein
VEGPRPPLFLWNGKMGGWARRDKRAHRSRGCKFLLVWQEESLDGCDGDGLGTGKRRVDLSILLLSLSLLSLLLLRGFYDTILASLCWIVACSLWSAFGVPAMPFLTALLFLDEKGLFRLSQALVRSDRV